MNRAERTAADIRAAMIGSVARRTGSDPDTVDPRQPFFALGLTSRDAAALCGELETRLGMPVPPLLPWRYPNIDSLAEHLADHPAPRDPADAPETPPQPSGSCDTAAE